MRFAGLADCSMLKAHGEAILIYKSHGESNDNAIKHSAASTAMQAEYDDFIVERLPVLGPINYS